MKIMNKKLTAVLAGAALLGGEALAEIDKFGLHWVAAADHSHIEIPENDAIDVRSVIAASGQEAIAIRAILKKNGSPEIQFELHRTQSVDFSIVENGVPTGMFWFEITAQQAMNGTVPTHTLQEAWQACLAKRYPDYLVTNLEEGFPAAGSHTDDSVVDLGL
jgi:hypothetical protein